MLAALRQARLEEAGNFTHRHSLDSSFVSHSSLAAGDFSTTTAKTTKKTAGHDSGKTENRHEAFCRRDSWLPDDGREVVRLLHGLNQMFDFDLI